MWEYQECSSLERMLVYHSATPSSVLLELIYTPFRQVWTNFWIDEFLPVQPVYMELSKFCYKLQYC